MAAGHARATALLAVHRSCPRCGAERAPRQRYCLECGLALPALSGGLAAGRRIWLRYLGWYPGDFVWRALAAAVLAAAGAAASIAFGAWRSSAHPGTLVAPAPATLTSAAAPAGGDRTRWPAGVDGFTVVLASLPQSGGTRPADALAARAARAGLPEVGVLDSSAHASLLPGYYVVFSGIYGVPSDAATALRSVAARGFAGAYTSQVSP